MQPTKILKDWLFKAYLKTHKAVPAGLVELEKYFRHYGPITFRHHREDGLLIAVSENYRYGSIITYANNEKELDAKIKDAILTSFGIPSVYAKEANLRREGQEAGLAYATA